MNVVGKVGSLIAGGVYSVATPFHPFGGAVDVIVVRQQDGTFRSTPWYVRFGKFQGVLKGAEKVVRIAVNGVEANFHMYLDNSGEAYFIKEIDVGKGSELNGVAKNDQEFSEGSSSINGDKNNKENKHVNNICRLEHSVSDSAVVQLQEECDSLDEEGRFYEFQDDESSLDDSEYGSKHYESLDGEKIVESPNLNSEVVLVSVDGHILTAPITALEQDIENVQLSTPQFHLGPGESAEFCDVNDEFSTGENSWADYISKLNAPKPNNASDNLSIINNGESTFCQQQLEVRDVEEEHACLSTETQNFNMKEKNIQAYSDLEDALQVKDSDSSNVSTHIEDLSSSSEANHTVIVANGDEEAAEFRNDDGSSLSCCSFPLNNDTSMNIKLEDEPADKNVDDSEDQEGLSPHSVTKNSELKDEQSVIGIESIDCTPERPIAEEEPQTTTSAAEIQIQSTARFEISLCGNKLHAGMGLDAAAEAFNAHRILADDFQSSGPSIIKDGNLIIRFRGQYLPWAKAAHIALGVAAFGMDLPIDHKDAIPVEQDNTPKAGNNNSGLASTPSGRRWRLWPIPFRRVKTLEHTNSTSSTEEEFVDSESVLHSSQAETTPSTPTSQTFHESPRKQFVRTNIPTNEQIASLNLKEGQNIVTFSFSTRVLGTQQVDAHIYLWKWNARIVISDVDGTITKSDVLGQFMPLVGKDWTQSGVAKLFSAIKENGYQLLFLSARAIVQAYLTRSFLLNLKQDGSTLPNGPVVISPDGLFPSLYREVIRRAPHEFKIACLEDIKKLFPNDYNPFYAGFGNRDTDELSYRKIGIPKGKIFIINPKGEVAISHRIDVKSYTSLHTLVNDMFPPTSLMEQEDFNSWNFWRVPLPEIDD
ncbi:phosphatidate phosphatase PAH1 isoform X2 [Humulus lupulus]|uniref:phosphatidate phosphatase PAH1 isoform X2 n=1 Tax=Humulus lupulus TaxID=3486 RepID=UPI002B411AC9|nr:phosphatidate phosphatase PAH1 isoform X2 [Humulus lupulus]XP_062087877.1 phosphatidate phosphatase PAH1 isoform X2 [Humulus lupulus]